MSERRPYLLWDVFTDRPFGGNQLAVLPEARGLSPTSMQTLAREFNLAETAFILPAETPETDFRIRIFTPTTEMPFAGHPLIGSAFALAHLGRVRLDQPRVQARIETHAGRLQLEIEMRAGRAEFAWLEQRPAEFGARWTEPAALAQAIGLSEEDVDVGRAPAQIVSTGVPYLILPVRDLAAVRRAQPGRPELRQALAPLNAGQPTTVCLYLFSLQAEDARHTAQARMFSTDPGDQPEDAATGSAAGPLGAYLARYQLAAAEALTIEQGYCMGRPALIHVTLGASGRPRVGGQAVLVGEGDIQIP